MGKVNALWMEEREKKHRQIAEEYIKLGYSPDDASEIAFEKLQEEDEANGQFGVGA